MRKMAMILFWIYHIVLCLLCSKKMVYLEEMAILDLST